ncbi:MAG TPA: glycoside hydrolase family 9 protein [Cellvibrionaceae bacterium]|nr:glycoside hydrolase family 9 protein [Cellvibrionaceae bacterium]
MKTLPLLGLLLVALGAQGKPPAAPLPAGLSINDKNYFHMQGLDFTVFSDIYPDGHQTGVTLIQHGSRVAANGDVRLEISPGQWSPVPAGGSQSLDKANGTISQTMSYPDPTKDKTGFNPINYPDLKFTYKVNVTALSGSQFKISVDLDQPLPAQWVGKVGFNLELFPGELFGKAFLMDQQAGIFPRQANGPIESHHGEFLAAPLAVGKTLTVAPDDDLRRITINNSRGNLELWDGRSNHNNGWYIVRSSIPANATKNAIEWVVTPNVVKDWVYTPVLQISQVGYTRLQPKKLVIEQDATDTKADEVRLYQLTAQGKQLLRKGAPNAWGKFLRYHYLTYDFSDVTAAGSYVLEYRGQVTAAFKIGDDVLSRHVWQPTLEYFLPMQMCHMRVNEKYRVWHGLDHLDDAIMAPVNLNHYDGYISGPSTLTKYKPGERVPNLNAGGWHDAGDFDLRVESQIGTVWLLAAMVEEFGLNYDATSIDQKNKLVEIHQPDGKNDALQQIEHGLLSVLGGYKAMGRVYRGIIDRDLRQYVMLGDGSLQTDNVPFNAKLAAGERKNDTSGTPDDRWVFTEDNPDRELYVAAGLAAAARVLKEYNPAMAKDSLSAAEDLYQKAIGRAKKVDNKTFAAAELYLSTRKTNYLADITALKTAIIADVAETAWPLGRVMNAIEDKVFVAELNAAVEQYQIKVRERAGTESPYGVPYTPNIWGAGWTIQEFGVHQYFFAKSWPQYTTKDAYLSALNFVLGVHPGSNTQSFASGVGARSATVAYGNNRADWSYIPGGVISGTALIRPDLPELKTWPFFWQQTEYVMGGGETNYMFLVLAVDAAKKSAK